MIPEPILKKYNSHTRNYEAGDFIYEQNTDAGLYFQIVSGKVKLNNISDDGREFIQHIFEPGHCFGEAMLFLDKKYPSNAIALTPCLILELPEDDFFKLLKDEPQYSLEINRNLAQRLYYKMLMSQNLFSKDPQTRLSALMEYFKQTHASEKTVPYLIPLTRQQMANLTGLRVETVIRAIKLMEKNGLLSIEGRKVYY